MRNFTATYGQTNLTPAYAAKLAPPPAPVPANGSAAAKRAKATANRHAAARRKRITGYYLLSAYYATPLAAAVTRRAGYRAPGALVNAAVNAAAARLTTLGALPATITVVKAN